MTICPIMSRPMLTPLRHEGEVYGEEVDLFEVDCKREECALWVRRTTGPHGCGLIGGGDY